MELPSALTPRARVPTVCIFAVAVGTSVSTDEATARMAARAAEGRVWFTRVLSVGRGGAPTARREPWEGVGPVKTITDSSLDKFY